MKFAIVLLSIFLLHNNGLMAQKTSILSPNQKIQIALFEEEHNTPGDWYLTASYMNEGRVSVAIPRIDLGLQRSDQDFHKNLRLLKVGNKKLINENYSALHGKKSMRSNTANEVVIYFENELKSKFNVIVRAYDDGITFRYEFPDKGGSYQVKQEKTSYNIRPETSRWMEKWNPANEGYYTTMSGEGVQKQEWCYPALFRLKDTSCWYMLHEADLDETYCGTKLSNLTDSSSYTLAFPNPKDGRGTGESLPTINLPWQSPWRVIIMGSLADVVESTLVEDVSTPSMLGNADWIKPGLVSWNYWSSNHGTKDYKIVTEFADLAAEMNWPYTLLDWEWDAMGNGGNLEDALKYIHSKGVKPLMWYNSGGNHTWVASTPKDRMLTHENRVAEFTRLQKLGVAGVKIDFFESEKQDMIKYYLDILKDAAQYKMMVYFHGSLVPRGWARTYPHLMTYEAVRGAEWYNNVPDFTMAAPEHNTILPFTRNVVGSMDYTPTTFTNSQFPHITSYGHELALSVLFESALQHMADRPEGYRSLPGTAKAFLRDLPTAWDDTRYLDGTPGKDAMLARQKGRNWYIAGISAELRERTKKINFNFLPKGIKYKLTLIADGAHDKEFQTRFAVVTSESVEEVKVLRRGGFAGSLMPIE